MIKFPPTRDLDLARSMELFMESAEEHSSELGLAKDELDALEQAAEEFEDALAQQAILQAALHEATVRKRKARRALERHLKPLTEHLKHDQELAHRITMESGLDCEQTPRMKTKSPEPPVEVSAVRVSACTCEISWSSLEPRRRESYLVEYSPDGYEWHYAGATQKRRFIHETIGSVPGYYRVAAATRGRSSDPSEAVAVFELSLAA